MVEGGGVGVGRTGEGSTAEVNLEETTVISNHRCPSCVLRRGLGGEGGGGGAVRGGRLRLCVTLWVA